MALSNSNMGSPYAMVLLDWTGAARVTGRLRPGLELERESQKDTSPPKTARPGARFRQGREVLLPVSDPNNTKTSQN